MSDLSQKLTQMEEALQNAQARIAELELMLAQRQSATNHPADPNLSLPQLQMLEAAIQHSKDAVVIADHQAQILFINPAFTAISGYEPQDILGKSPDVLLASVNDQKFLTDLNTNLQKGIPFETELITHHKDGHQLVLSWSTAPIHNAAQEIVNYVTILRDITAQKEREATLLASEEKYRSLIESSDAAISMVDNDGKYLFLNAISAIPFGVSADQLIGKTVHDLFVAAEADQIMMDVRQVIRENKGMVLETSVEVAGKRRWFRTSIQPVRDSEGKPFAAFIYATEITLQKEAETQQRAILEAIPDLMFRQRIDGTYIGYHAPNPEQLVFPPEIFMGKKPREIFTSEFADIIMNAIERATSTQQVVEVEYKLALHGKWSEFESRFIPVEDTEVLSLIRDVTERKQAEKELKMLYNATAYLFNANSVKKLGEQIVAAVIEEFSHIDCGLVITDKENRKIHRVARSGKYNINPQVPLMLDGAGLVPLAIRSQKAIYIPDVTLEPNYLLNEAKTRSELVIPLKTIRGVIGALDLQSAEVDAFDDAHLRVLMAYAERAAAALENIYLYEEVNEHALHLEQRVKDRTAELENANNRIEAIFNHSADGIVLLDIHEGIQHANHAFEQMFDLTEKPYRGLRLTDFIDPDYQDQVKSTIETISISHKTHRLELRAQRHANYFFDVEISISPVNRSQESVKNLVCIIRDVTERKKAEDELRRNQADLESVINSSNIAFALLDIKGNIRILNNLAYEFSEILFGVRPQIGTPMSHYVSPQRLPIFQQAIQGVLKGNTVIADYNTTINDQTRRFAVRYHPVKSYDGEILGINIAFQDVTEEKQTEEKLRYLASLQAHMHDAVIGTDLDYRIKSWNQAAERIYGWSAAEVIGKLLPEVMDTRFPSGETAIDAGQSLLEKGFWNGEAIQTHRNKHDIVVLGSIVLQKDETGTPTGIVAVNHDITERKQQEAALAKKYQEEHQMQEYLKTLHEVSIELTRTRTLDEFYRRTIELGLVRFGFERMGLLLYDKEADLVRGTYGTDPNGNIISEYNLQLKPHDLTGILARTLDREVRFVFDEVTPLFHHLDPIGIGWNAVAAMWNHNVLGWLAIDNGVKHQPITKPHLDIFALYALTVGSLLERKYVEQKLLALSQRLELATQSGGIGIWDWDLINDILVWDDRMLALYGMTSHEFTGTVEAWNQSLHPEDYAKAQMDIRTAIEEGKPFDTEFRITLPNGSIRHIKANAIVLLDNQAKARRVIGVNQDITELKRAIEQEKELGNLKSRFVSMASHEFRTPLATISALTETLQAYWAKLTHEQIEQRFVKIQDQINHMKNIMEDVLQLSRIQAQRIQVNRSLFDLDALCRSVLDEFESRPTFSHRIDYHCDEELKSVNLDRKLMRQIINNLVSNAIKYSLSNTTITVILKQVENHLVFTISDQGIGIPDADHKNLFHPFHRGINVGTISGNGLGLAITKEAVELQGGTITFASNLNVGTTFTVTIPINEGSITHDQDSPD